MVQVFCDFDGTITSRDSIVFLTESFGAGSRYRSNILQAIREGRISVTEAIERELATVRVSWEKAKEALKANISVDPTFPQFVEWCRNQGYALKVVSAGMKPVLDLFIGEFPVPRFAHSVEFSARGWRYRQESKHRKEVILKAAKTNGTLIYIGDGTSDVVAIPYADLLFAKSYLAEHCRRHQIPFCPYDSFDDVRRTLTAKLG